MSIPIDNLANLRSVIEQLEGAIRERDALLIELQRVADENERLRGRCAALAFLQYGGPSPGVEPPTDVPNR